MFCTPTFPNKCTIAEATNTTANRSKWRIGGSPDVLVTERTNAKDEAKIRFTFKL